MEPEPKTTYRVTSTEEHYRSLQEDIFHQLDKLAGVEHIGMCGAESCSESLINHISQHVGLFMRSAALASAVEAVQEEYEGEWTREGALALGEAFLTHLVSEAISNMFTAFLMAGLEAALLDPDWARRVLGWWKQGLSAGEFSGEVRGMEIAKTLPQMMIEHFPA